MLSAYRSGQGFQGTDEYAPPGADNSLMAIGLPDACLVTNPAVVLASSDDGNIPAWDPANGHCDATYCVATNNDSSVRPSICASPLILRTPVTLSFTCATTPHGKLASMAK